MPCLMFAVEQQFKLDFAGTFDREVRQFENDNLVLDIRRTIQVHPAEA